MKAILHKRKNFKNNYNKQDIKSQIINKQAEEITSLKNTISILERDNHKKDEIIKEIDMFRRNIKISLETLNAKSNEYNKLISELKEMKFNFNKMAFDGKWNLIRFFINK